MPFVWVDPPGGHGWVHEIRSADEIEGILAEYTDMPADNEARRRAYDEAHEGETVEQYQAGRDFWGITYSTSAPEPIPEGVTLYGLDGEKP